MTTRFPTHTAPTWMLAHRGKVLAALAGALTAAVVVTAVATVPTHNEEPSPAQRSTISYPASREGVRGPIFEGSESLSGLTNDIIQPSAAEPKYPASREGVRGPIFEGSESLSGLTNDIIQPSAAEPKYPASREGVRGPIFEGSESLSGLTNDIIQPSAAEPKYPASREGVRGPIFD